MMNQKDLAAFEIKGLLELAQREIWRAGYKLAPDNVHTLPKKLAEVKEIFKHIECKILEYNAMNDE